MPFAEFGVILLFLVGVFLLSRLWFQLVEGILHRIRRLFTQSQKPTQWHSLPPQQEEDDHV